MKTKINFKKIANNFAIVYILLSIIDAGIGGLLSPILFCIPVLITGVVSSAILFAGLEKKYFSGTGS
ncbi:TPA: hypothetical protein DIC38_03130 [Candidatus Nomurabacteria bacterium]|nr:MAG: hypothetical protein O210_OD1C00001G0157 [Parcubacteria bacterium RAAC4_OD1_1]HCY26646.1 hypothetical protein [Candidatus Nomurabacteria bacterium]